MKILQKYLFLALALFFLLLSCDEQESGKVLQKSEEEVTLQVKFDRLFSGPSTRAQGTSPSANADGDNREDFVGKVAMLVFDHDDAGKKVADAYVVEPVGDIISAKMKEGTYDFFFIANYPDDDDLKRFTEKSQVLAYLQKLKPFKVHKGVEGNSTQLFPMSRVYLNQTIKKNEEDPAKTPFYPEVGIDRQLAPVSNYGKDWEKEADGALRSKQKIVRFVRSCAKIQLNIIGEGRGDIENVKYFNAAANYSFAELDPIPATQAVAAEQLFTIESDDDAQISSGNIYVPERLFGAEEEKGWDNTSDAAKGGVNYIQITMKGSGVIYKIPIISNKLGANESYLGVARGNSTTAPDYNILRNHFYRIDCKLDKTIEVFYTIGDWNVEDKSLFMGMGYQVELVNGEVTVTNTIPACEPHKVTLKPVNGATLNGGIASVDFTSLTEGATASYTVDNSATPAGSAYLEIYYNDKLVKSYIK